MNETTEPTSYVNTAFFARIRDAVDDIYNRTSGTMPLKQGFVSINKNDLYRKVAWVLVDQDIVKNYGSKNEPSYSWTSNIRLTESIYHRVYKGVREYSKRYYENKKGKKKSEVQYVDPKLVGKPFEELVVKEPVSLSLDSFSDQQLWDELKERGFIVVENRLCKTITLN